MSFFNGFIGTSPNSNLLFTGGDTKSTFEKNLKVQPADWYYRNCNISYKKNENGHRCKNISEIDLDNYILFTGCSYTEGIGIELEKTFAYLLSQKLNVDYYNLALGGSGPDVCFFNLIKFYFTVKKLPKFLILQLPQATRFLTFSKKSPMDIPFYNLNGIWIEECKDFILEGEELNYFNSKSKLFLRLIQEIYTCPIINLLPSSPETCKQNEVRLLQIDESRDRSHPGILSNERIAQRLLEAMQKHDKYLDATVHSTFRG